MHSTISVAHNNNRVTDQNDSASVWPCTRSAVWGAMPRTAGGRACGIAVAGT